LLDVLATARVRGTFFVLGWIAERQPDLVSRIAGGGHEIASHGYDHRMITQQTPEEFAADLRRSLRVLRALSGQAVVGYRAPSFSVVRETLWALDILMDHGIVYDSSIYPVHHDRYGIPGTPRAPYRVRWGDGRELWELPPATLRVLGRTLPAAGGGYLRLLPYAHTEHTLRRMNAAGMPGVVYTHPWEYDVDQPRVKLPPLRRLRHYARIATTPGKFERLLRDFEFTTCLDVLEASRATPEPTPAARPLPAPQLVRVEEEA
jgi:polysaccharide deacetylase family protein (PEP-CTERM system associated)